MIKCIYAPYVTYKGFSSATIRKILMSPALVYFIDYWEDLYSGISSKRDLLKIFNPRVVIQEILDEITLNKQTNKANEEFFRRTLSNYLKNDPASLKRLRIHLQMILKEFDLVKKRPRYLPKLCMSTLDIFQNLEYFEDCIECLINLNSIASLTESDKQHIKVIVII